MKLLGDIAGIFTGFLSEVGLNSDLILYLGIGFIVLMIIFFVIKSHFAYEGRLSRHLDKLNRWLYYNQNIDSTNLIAFNNKMKKSPKTLRYYWQQYMLYREHNPSHYMSTYNCIEKPLHTSSYNANIKNLQSINLATMIVTFVLSLAQLSTVTDSNTISVISALCNALFVPMLVAVLSTIFLMILRTMQNYNLSSLYQNFHLFQRYIDKATTTLPEYVDFEVLFTQKEIKRGIPVLNEYLEKRARQEQEELEKARLYAVEHEKYDFAKSGINGALVLDRAMKETEIYLNIRQRLLSEIQQLEAEIDSKKRNYENISKDYQRKMQASKENVERLRTQQEETTNRIESNYIKKQQGDEIKKQEQLDKDQEDATVKFNHEIETLQAEIEKRRTDLESRKVYVEEAMLAEYQTFSEKLYKQVAKAVDDKHDEEKREILDEKDAITNELNEAHNTIDVLNKEIEGLRKVIENAGIEEGEHGGFYSSALKEEAGRVRVGKQNSKRDKKIEETIEEVKEEPVQEPAQEQVEQPAQESEGYYDENGYYWYPNGTYYDDKGNYYDEFGGHYDAEGNYFPPEENIEQPAEPVVSAEQVEEVKGEESNEPQLDEYGGYYDAEGYYRYPNGTYYDPEGNYYDEFGGHYDANGNYFPPEENIEQQAEQVEEVKIEKSEEPSEETLTTDKNVQLDSELEELIRKFKEEKTKAQNEKAKKEEIVESSNDDVEDEIIELKTQEDFADEQPVKEKRGPGRPRKVVDESTQPQEKRGRGRPRKEVTEETPQEKRGRGRPRKEVTEEKPVEEKRGPGRPKKVEEKPVEVKNGPGRPKKTVVEETPQEKRGRGRPRKEATEEKTQEAKRGRGRPRKEENQVDELSELNKRIQEEQEKLFKEQNELSKQVDDALNKIADKDKE